jgi:hypothetical protein
MTLRHLKRIHMPKRGGGPNFGNRCKADAPGCAICDAFHFKDRTGRFPRSWDELGANRRESV